MAFTPLPAYLSSKTRQHIFAPCIPTRATKVPHRPRLAPRDQARRLPADRAARGRACGPECGQIFDSVSPDLKERLPSTSDSPHEVLDDEENSVGRFRRLHCYSPTNWRANCAGKSMRCRAAIKYARALWSWRLIDGRKCWYEGKTTISKSLLQWPAQASAQPKSDGGPKGLLTEKPNDPLDSQAWVPNDGDSFEARWRARAVNN